MERIASEVESRMLGLAGGLDPGDSLRMTEKVLRHATRPAADTGQRGGGGHAESLGDFVHSQRDERLIVRGEDILPTRAPDEDADQLPPLRSAPGPFSGRPGAGQNRALLGARNDIAVAIQRVGDLLATVGQGDDGGRCVRDRRQLHGQHGIEISKEIRGGVRRGGDDDRIRRDRLARRQANVKCGARPRHGHGRIAEDERSPGVPEPLLQRHDQRVETGGGCEKRGLRRAGPWRRAASTPLISPPYRRSASRR